MKCRLLRPMNRHFRNPAEVQEFKKTKKMPQWPAGTILDEPEAYLHVQGGYAEPADEECEQSHGMTLEQLTAARKAYNRVDKGIVPEDFELFDQGIILGYDENGDYIPGPNWIDEAAPEEEVTND